VIERSFQLLPGIGPWRERDLWSRGLLDWHAFRAAPQLSELPAKDAESLWCRIAEAEVALRTRDLGRLAALLPQREHWRLYPAFLDEAVFLDIETDGAVDGHPTVVSLFDRRGLHVFLRGQNLEALPEALQHSRMWVTFNGRCFDVPVLRRHFADLPEPIVHLDLRFLCRRVGLRGGLKAVEQEIGISRPPHLRGVGGWDAVLLWRSWVATDEVAALRFLVEYNLYDAFQLRALADVAYNLAVEQLAFDEERIPVWERGELLYDVSRLVLALGPTAGDAVRFGAEGCGSPMASRCL
jgi:uncharacterized protein YprB with RNaseH-like and TPR domain